MKYLITCLLLCTITIMNAQMKDKFTVDVAGEGIVKVVPDEVSIAIRVEHSGKDAALVKQQNDRVINEVFSFLKKHNIPDTDIATQYIRVNKNYDYNTKSYNYVANQAVQIRLKELSKYESVMNGLLQTGVNRIDGVSFASSKQEQLESEARIKAMQNAKEKATQYASAINQTIGRAVAISEFQPNVVPGPMFRNAMAMDSESGGQQTIAPGEMEIKCRVNVSFLLIQ